MSLKSSLLRRPSLGSSRNLATLKWYLCLLENFFEPLCNSLIAWSHSNHSLVQPLCLPWDDRKQLYDPNDMWMRWKELFLNVCEKHALMKTKRTRGSKSPWITTILKKRMNFRDRLKRKAIKTKDPFIWNIFRKAKNQVNCEKNSAKKAIMKMPSTIVVAIKGKLGKQSMN